jgi:hypothetical protein
VSHLFVKKWGWGKLKRSYLCGMMGRFKYILEAKEKCL